MLELDRFFWETLGREPVTIEKDTKDTLDGLAKSSKIITNTVSLHDEMKEKVEKIGRWLGFDTKVEVKVAKGSVVDVIWELAIANLGRTIYVFEIQSKGSLDSLFVNLTCAKNNPAVQGLVTVSDKERLSKIKRKTVGLNLSDLKTWSFDNVESIHRNLEEAHTKLNELNLIPSGFYSKDYSMVSMGPPFSFHALSPPPI